MTYGIIYVVENTINGKKYVGQTVQPLKVRWQRHCRKEQSGCVALASAIAKYGADAFKVSEVAQASTKELNLFLGWTFVGWVGALVWAMTDNVKPPEKTENHPRARQNWE